MLAAIEGNVIKTTEDAPVGEKGEKGVIGQRGPYVRF